MNKTITQKELPRVAVVEDEPDLLACIVDFLQACGYPVWGATCSQEFFFQLSDSPVDIVVLDIELPGDDGFTIARQLHSIPNIGIVIASARDQINDRLTGLESGADVYLVKPVDLRELVANIQSVFRRVVKSERNSELEMSHWLLNMQDWTWCAPDARSLPLTPKEFLVVRTLVDANGEVVSKAQIAAVLSGGRSTAGVDYHSIDVLIARLRKKCLDVLGYPLPIRTVTATGFLLTAPAKIRNC